MGQSLGLFPSPKKSAVRLSLTQDLHCMSLVPFDVGDKSSFTTDSLSGPHPSRSSAKSLKTLREKCPLPWVSAKTKNILIFTNPPREPTSSNPTFFSLSLALLPNTSQFPAGAAPVSTRLLRPSTSLAGWSKPIATRQSKAITLAQEVAAQPFPQEVNCVEWMSVQLPFLAVHYLRIHLTFRRSVCLQEMVMSNFQCAVLIYLLLRQTNNLCSSNSWKLGRFPAAKAAPHDGNSLGWCRFCTEPVPWICL